MMSSMCCVVGVYSSTLVSLLPVESWILLACLRSGCLVLEQLFLELAVVDEHVASSCWNAVPVIHNATVLLCSSLIGLPVVPCIHSSSGVGVVLVSALVVALHVAVEVVHVACDCSTVGGVNVGCSRTPRGTGRGCSTRLRGSWTPSEQTMLGGRKFVSLSGFGCSLFLVGGELGRVVIGNEYRCPWLFCLVPLVLVDSVSQR